MAGVLLAGLTAAACTTQGGTHTSSGTTATTVPRRSTSTTTTATATTSVTPAPSTTSTSTAVVACSRVTASPGQTQGAAGTVIGTITLTEVGSAACTVLGYPSLARFSASGAPVPVTVVHGLTVNLSGPAVQPPSSVTMTASRQGEFTFQYSDVPTGSETTCASSTTLSVTLPGGSSGSPPAPLTMAPCDNGTIDVSPIYAATPTPTPG